MELTLTFTGRKPAKIYGYDEKRRADYSRIVETLERHIEQIFLPIGYTRFITGGTQGFDQLAFWTVQRLKVKYPNFNIKNIVYVPHEKQAKVWSKEGLFSQEEYKHMLQCADEVIDITKINNIDVSTKQGVVKALFTRNEAMCNNSHAIIGFYTQGVDFTKDNGGTAGCLTYASKQRHLDVYILDEQNLTITKIKERR